MNRRAVGKIDFPIKDDEDAEDRCTESTLRSGLFAYRGFIGRLDDPAADLEIRCREAGGLCRLDPCSTRISTGSGRRSQWKRLCDVFRRECLRTRRLRVGSGSSGNAGWQYPIGCRQHRTSERIGNHKFASLHDLLVTETLGNRLLAFKIDGDGALRHRKVFANFEGMNPLGICEDAEGAVWAAAARQSLFVRVQQGGRVRHRVHVPGRHAVACQLDGQDG